MSKEVEEAIKNCNLLLAGDIMLHILDDDGGTAYSGEVNKLYNKDLETVLNYIKELEEDNCKWRANYVLLSAENGVIPKQVIRDKIEELRKEKQKYDNEIRIYTMRESFVFQEMILKELLEEE